MYIYIISIKNKINGVVKFFQVSASVCVNKQKRPNWLTKRPKFSQGSAPVCVNTQKIPNRLTKRPKFSQVSPSVCTMQKSKRRLIFRIKGKSQNTDSFSEFVPCSCFSI
jgi:hypothetical protein